MEEKQEFILHWKSGKYSISHLADMFGISRPTAYKFINRYSEFGKPGLYEKSGKPIFEIYFRQFFLGYAEYERSKSLRYYKL